VPAAAGLRRDEKNSEIAADSSAGKSRKKKRAAVDAAARDSLFP
jgi:hypothetical protein